VDKRTDKDKEKSKRSKSRGRKCRDWKCVSCAAHCFGSKAACFKCGAPRPGTDGVDVKMAAAGVGEELDDYWADSCRDASTGARDAGRDVGAADRAVAATSIGVRRQLVARGSRERSPRGGTKFWVGDRVVLHGLAARFELNSATGAVVTLPSGNGGEQRYGVQLDSKDEKVGVKMGNLNLVVSKPGIFKDIM
jgi:hypothetical protein